MIIRHEQHEQTVKLHHALQKTVEEATSKVSQPGKIHFLNFSHVDINAMVKAIFNEEANLQTANRINEVLLRVNRKDKSQSRDRICLQEI